MYCPEYLCFVQKKGSTKNVNVRGLVGVDDLEGVDEIDRV